MNFRIARHTSDLKPITDFYCNIVGLEILGSFQNHNNYDGIFIGLKETNWHLEFTMSNELPNHKPDDDDLLVFYADSSEDYYNRIKNISEKGVLNISNKNPYWNDNGTTYKDPDGFLIVIALPK